MITYGNISVSPYKLQQFDDLQIVHKINDHSTLKIKAILAETEKDNPIFETTFKTQIEVNVMLKDKDPLNLFTGMVQSIKIDHIKGVYYVEIDAISNTAQMDIKLRDRSFQDKNMTYESLTKKIISEYPDSDAMDTISKGKKLENFVMQYLETDWQFLKRLASHFNAGIVTYANAKSPKFFFGLPKGNNKGKLENYNYSLTKKINSYLISKQNYNETLEDLDSVSYQIISSDIFNLGDIVTFQDKSLCVNNIVVNFVDGSLLSTCDLSTVSGCSQDKIFNLNIVGLALQGDVLEASKDKLKLHLCIDEKQDKGSATLIRYSTPYTADGNAGWYCMPEIGDTCLLYFPTKNESDCFVINSLRKEDNKEDKLSDPDVKIFRTKFGKELRFSKEEILISAVDSKSYIQINEKNGINIISDKPISINTKENLNILSEKSVIITGKQKATISCKSSSVTLDGDATIQGKSVKQN